MTTNFNQNLITPENLKGLFNSSEVTHLENIPEINENEITFIKVEGVIDESTKNDILSNILNSIISSPKNIVFDLKKLTYINCSGLNMFLYIGNLIDLKINKIIFINIPSKIYKIFEIFGLHKIFIFHSTYENAIIEHVNKSILEKKCIDLDKFPVYYHCSNCSGLTYISLSGKNFCFHCKTGITINSSGQIEVDKN